MNGRDSVRFFILWCTPKRCANAGTSHNSSLLVSLESIGVRSFAGNRETSCPKARQWSSSWPGTCA
jgi:hypothetical protein